jgi:hypothetical protein
VERGVLLLADVFVRGDVGPILRLPILLLFRVKLWKGDALDSKNGDEGVGVDLLEMDRPAALGEGVFGDGVEDPRALDRTSDGECLGELLTVELLFGK